MVRACELCLRRSWLLSRLSPLLDYRAGQEEHLLGLLELSDARLVEVLGGSRKDELRREYRARAAGQPVLRAGAEVICVHDQRYPASLKGDALAPRALYVRGGLRRLETLAQRSGVAIVGTRRPTDYGVAMARELARSLSRCGVTVIASLADGIARAVVAGVSEAGEPALALAAGGVDDPRPASQRALWESLSASGCLLSELPCGVRPRRWCEVARERTIASLCELLVVIEAGASEQELRVARMAARLRKHVGALPGRVTSPASLGTNALLAGGAPMVRGPQDVLDLLALGRLDDTIAVPRIEEAVARERLAAGLQDVLDRIGAGQDTLARLTAEGGDPSTVMAALGELELLGCLTRGDGGRYVPNLRA